MQNIIKKYNDIIDNLQNNDLNGSWSEILEDNNNNYKDAIKELKNSLIVCIDIYEDDTEILNFYKYQLKLVNQI